MDDLLQINENDNVGIALKLLPVGSDIDFNGCSIAIEECIGKGHKVSLKHIKGGDTVLKYGYPIGTALRDIAPGHWVHTHNLSTGLNGLLSYEYTPIEKTDQPICGPKKEMPVFFGYPRENGSVGIRNEIWVVPTVSCVNSTACKIAQYANETYRHRNIDGVFAFTHPYGCSQMGEDHLTTQKILAGLVNHPNAGGVLVVSLGCENNNIEQFQKVLGSWDKDRVKFLIAQEEPDEFEAGLKQIGELVRYVSGFQREPVPVSELKVGLKCGGSDGFSGISANPLTGMFTDMLIELGGTAVLTEVPEMFGAECILMDRAKDIHVFNEIVKMINSCKDYFIRHGQSIYENPSPGNNAGGISTLEEKSLGCILKGGNGTVLDVLQYGGAVSNNGLNLLAGPGNDLVSITALAASGCQIILFTTGRGNPLGTCVPTVKISSSTELYMKKRNWIDFDAGRVFSGENMSYLSQSLIELVQEIASGERYTRNEINGVREIGIFKDGVIL